MAYWMVDTALRCWVRPMAQQMIMLLPRMMASAVRRICSRDSPLCRVISPQSAARRSATIASTPTVYSHG